MKKQLCNYWGFLRLLAIAWVVGCQSGDASVPAVQWNSAEHMALADGGMLLVVKSLESTTDLQNVRVEIVGVPYGPVELDEQIIQVEFHRHFQNRFIDADIPPSINKGDSFLLLMKLDGEVLKSSTGPHLFDRSTPFLMKDTEDEQSIAELSATLVEFDKLAAQERYSFLKHRLSSARSKVTVAWAAEAFCRFKLVQPSDLLATLFMANSIPVERLLYIDSNLKDCSPPTAWGGTNERLVFLQSIAGEKLSPRKERTRALAISSLQQLRLQAKGTFDLEIVGLILQTLEEGFSSDKVTLTLFKILERCVKVANASEAFPMERWLRIAESLESNVLRQKADQITEQVSSP